MFRSPQIRLYCILYQILQYTVLYSRVVRAFVFGVYGETNEATRAEISEMAMVGAAKLWRSMGQTSQVKAYAVLKHSLTRSLGIAAVRANARMRLRVLSLLSKGGTSVPVGSAADENRHYGITKKQNEKITAAMALGPVRLSLRIATTASRCRGGHVRDPINMPRDSGV